MNDIFSLGRKLRELMDQWSYSAEKLSIMLKTRGYEASRELIIKWCNGTRTPSSEALCAICDCFNISADYLLGRVRTERDDTSLEYAADIIGLPPKSAVMLADLYSDSHGKASFVLGTMLSSNNFSATAKAISRSRDGISRQIRNCGEGKNLPDSFVQSVTDMADMYIMKAQAAMLPLLREALGYDELMRLTGQEVQNGK